jgi:hypothetical protein
MLQAPNSDWPIVREATSRLDPANITPVVRVFTDEEESGIGFGVFVPKNVTAMRVRLLSRPSDSYEGEKRVVIRLYARCGADAWRGPNALGVIDYSDKQYWTEDSKFATVLSALSIKPGNLVQFELTRNPGGRSDLTGDWILHEVGVNFIGG